MVALDFKQFSVIIFTRTLLIPGGLLQLFLELTPLEVLLKPLLDLVVSGVQLQTKASSTTITIDLSF